MEITDPQTVRALAHPLRLDLIELLGQEPMTAAECARALHSTQASCSFHLRQLAKYGFVEEAVGGPDRRERRWRLIDYRQSWSSDDPAHTGALDEVFARREGQRLVDWTRRAAGESDEWRRHAMMLGACLPLTPEELADVRARLTAVAEHLVAAYADRIGHRSRWPDGARPVRVLMTATPHPHRDPVD